MGADSGVGGNIEASSCSDFEEYERDGVRDDDDSLLLLLACDIGVSVLRGG